MYKANTMILKQQDDSFIFIRREGRLVLDVSDGKGDASTILLE